MLRLEDGMHEISVVTIGGHVYLKEATAATTARDLKAMVEAHSAIPWTEQRLIYERRVVVR